MLPLRKAGLMAFAFLALTFVGAATARADTIVLAQGGSTNANVQSPNFPGSNATATFSLDGNTLTITLTNTSTYGTFVSGLGFDTTPDLVLQIASATNGWAAAAGPGGGLGSFEMIAFGNGNPDRLGANESTTAIFTFTTSPSSITFDAMVAHLTSLPNEESEKVPATHTPEPVTMLLFGSGLAGIAARARRRLAQHERLRVGGRMHAVVRRGAGLYLTSSINPETS